MTNPMMLRRSSKIPCERAERHVRKASHEIENYRVRYSRSPSSIIVKTQHEMRVLWCVMRSRPDSQT